jgi:hypothetical protein
MTSVPQKDIDELLHHMMQNVPKLQIIYKDEPMPTLFLKFVMAFINFVGLFSKSFKTKWYNNFASAFSNTIMMPSRKTHGDFSNIRNFILLRHEYVHVLDMKKYPIIFPLTYLLLPLPLLFSGRAYWELRGYAQNIIVRAKYEGVIPDSNLENITNFFCGGMYLYMFPFRKTVRKRLERLRDDVYQGKVFGENPDISI